MINHAMIARFRAPFRRRMAMPLLPSILLGAALCSGMAHAQNAAVTVNVNTQTNRHSINPNIYGIAYGTTATLSDLNAPLNRQGGNNTSRYNWQLNADNKDFDYYFESIGDSSAVAGERGDSFIRDAKAGGAQAMLTIPLIDWVAKLGPNRGKLASFSIAKYGAQTGNDWQWFPDAGNGIRSNGSYVTGNDPNDANVPSTVAFQQGWVQHLVSRWGAGATGGLRYYLLDNESSIWFASHRDVAPTGLTMDQMKTKMISYATMIKTVDPSALVVGPEEWGWDGYRFSGYDQQYGSLHGYSSFPDRASHGNIDYVPYLLDQFRQEHVRTGKRLLDIFSLHIYPQGGEFSDDTSTAMQQRRNRSTRALWDPTYVDETWINTQVQLIPRMKGWVNTYYPGTPTAITEYNWGAEGHINGATTQADILGIFGREGLDMATRWTTPSPSTPTYKAMKLYRNYDGNNSTFGDTSVAASTATPDNLSAFAATRTADGALTVMVINKVLSGTTPVTVNLANFAAAGSAQVWQLTATNAITHLANVAASASVTLTVPAQSITLLVVPPASTASAYKIHCGGSAVGSFSADAYFSGGVVYSITKTVDTTGVANAAPAALYQAMRCTNFSYSLPGLTAGASYTVRLHFAEPYYSNPAVGKRIFNVAINGTTVLANFDITAAAGSVAKAVVRDFTVVADGSGNITIATTNVVDVALINGIEVLGGGATAPAAPTSLTATAGNALVNLAWTAASGATSYNVYRATTTGGPYTLIASAGTAMSYLDTGLLNGTTYFYVVTAVNATGESAYSNQASASPATQTALYRIHCGGGAVGSFSADNYFSGGVVYSISKTVDTSGVANAAPAALYQTMRCTNFSYSLPGLTAGGSYTVRLHFAEPYYSDPAVGKRIFNVAINGTTVLANFDITAAAGGVAKAVVRDFTVLADGSGNITIATTNVVDVALINGIEILH